MYVATSDTTGYYQWVDDGENTIVSTNADVIAANTSEGVTDWGAVAGAEGSSTLKESDDGYSDAMGGIESMMEALGMSLYNGMPLYMDDGSTHNWTGGGQYAAFGTTPYAQGARGNSKWASGGTALADDLTFYISLLGGLGYALKDILKLRIIVARHGAHHTFGKLGKRKHIQMMTFLKGVKGSHRILRIPLPGK